MAQDRGGGRPFEVRGYRDVSQIGRGASSTVYKGYDPELSRWVAIKVLLTDDPDDPARKRFKREGEITANLGKHPHIVQVLGTGFTDSDSPYVVMELFEQGSIGDRLRTSGAFTVEETLDVGEKIADAVAAAHRAGVLHRDIKPQNILLSEYGPALGDFGIARTSANLEWSQSLDQLTPMHAAPEILLGGTSTVQSDLYALGSTLYTMLSGRPPFAGPPGEAPLRYQVRVMQDPVPPIPRADLPVPVVEAIERTLAKNPADRYRSAAELRDVLRSCLHQGAGAVAEPAVAPPAPAAPLTPARSPAVVPPPPEPASPAVTHLAQPLPTPPPISVAPDDTVTRTEAAAPAPAGDTLPRHTTVPDDPPTAPTMFPGLPTLPGPPVNWLSSGAAPAPAPTSPAPTSPAPTSPAPAPAPAPAPPSPSPSPAKLDDVTPAPRPGTLVPPDVAARETADTGARARAARAEHVGDQGELTVQRPISTLGPAAPDEPAENGGGGRRRLLLIGTAVAVILAGGVGALLLLGKPAPAKLPVKKEYTITTTDTDQPATLSLVSTGSGATLRWSPPPGYQGAFLVIEDAGGHIRSIGHGKSSVSLPGLDQSSFTGCFQVRALINAHTTGKPADACYTDGALVSGN